MQLSNGSTSPSPFIILATNQFLLFIKKRATNRHF
jgi:hypothetical protein